jgi:hypothetical protein
MSDLERVTDAPVAMVMSQILSPIQPSVSILSSFLLANVFSVKGGDEGDDAGTFIFLWPLIRFSNFGWLPRAVFITSLPTVS